MSELIDIEKYFKALRILISPSSSGDGTQLTDIFKTTIQIYNDHIRDNEVHLKIFSSQIFGVDLNSFTDEDDVGWLYVIHCLKLLFSICNTLRPSQNENEFIISVDQQKLVSNCFQFVIGLGISSNLIPGVGLPIDCRSSFAQIIKVLLKHQSVWVKYRRLAICTEIFIECSKNQQLGSLILSLYLDDIIAALCQLCFTPLKKPDIANNEHNEEDAMTVERYDTLMIQRNDLSILLNNLMERTYPPILTQTFFRLQSTAYEGHKVPRWMKNTCGNLLTKILLQKNGIFSIIQGFNCDSAEKVSSSVPEWKKYDLIAKLISSPPKNFTGEEYIIKIADQILNLMKIVGNKNSALNLVVSGIVYSLLTNYPAPSVKYLLEPVIVSLKELDHQKPNISGAVSVDNGQLMVLIYNLEALCCKSGELLKCLSEVIETIYIELFMIFEFLFTSLSPLSELLSTIITKYLTNLQPFEAVIVLRSTIVKCSEKSSKITVCFNDDNNLIIVANCSENQDVFEVDQRYGDAIVSILSEIPEELLTREYFLQLMKDLGNILQEDPAESEDERLNESETLLGIEKQQETKFRTLRNNLILLYIVSGISEKIGSSLLKEKSEIIKFIMTTLERGAQLCSNKRENTPVMESETLTMAMSVLTTVMVDDRQLSSSEKLEIYKCAPSLKDLSSQHPDQAVKFMAKELKDAIVNSTVTNSKKLSRDSKLDHPKEEINNRPQTEFSNAWHDLSDPLLPVKGHGLLALRKLIVSKDAETLKNKHKVLAVFQDNLSNEDSYIYLAAVQGLASLSDIFPDDTINHLTTEFVKPTNSDKEIEIKMKVGEVLVKVSHKLGNMIPKYRDVLLNTFLTGLKDSDAHIRASCLSNIGEVCKGLRFSIGPYLQEILSSLRYAINQTEANEVRRAAVLVITLIFQGCGIDSLKVLDSEIRDIYRGLKLLYNMDKDEIVRLHAEIALNEINSFMKKFAFPETRFEKKITILDKL